MVRELAALTGVSLVVAVTEAVREKLEREKTEREEAQKASSPKRSELLLAFAKEYVARVHDPVHSWEVDDLLYDEYGLPK